MEYTPVVLRGDKKTYKIIESNKDLLVTEGRDHKYGEPQGIEGRPKEKHQDHDQLRCNEEIGKPRIMENTFLHDFSVSLSPHRPIAPSLLIHRSKFLQHFITLLHRLIQTLLGSLIIG
jgi:hypothetical protein